MSLFKFLASPQEKPFCEVLNIVVVCNKIFYSAFSKNIGLACLQLGRRIYVFVRVEICLVSCDSITTYTNREPFQQFFYTTMHQPKFLHFLCYTIECFSWNLFSIYRHCSILTTSFKCILGTRKYRKYSTQVKKT